MANANVIREFLVRLGWQVDQGGMKRFGNAISTATAQAAKLGAVVVATATAVEVGVERIARQMEDMYYASQKAASSVRNMMAFGYGASHIGLTAEEARAQLEGLATAMRNNPGVEGLVRNLGVETRDANLQMRDTAEVMGDLIARFKQMPWHVAVRFAEQLGISSDALFLLTRGFDAANKARDDFMRRLKEAGLDVDDLAEKSKNFSNELRKLESGFSMLGMIMESRFLPIATTFLHWAQTAIDWIIRLDQATDGWSTTIGAIAIGLGTVSAALALLMPIFSIIASGFVAVGAAIGGVVAVAAALAGSPIFAAMAALAATWAIIQNWDALKGALNSFFDWATPKLQWLWDKMSGIRDFFKSAPKDRGPAYQGALPPDESKLPVGLRNNNPGNLRWWPGAERVDGFAKFKTAEEGLSKMAANLLTYGRRGHNTLESIISKWAPSSDGNNVAAYVAAASKKTGFGANQRLNLQDPETLRKVMDAMIQVENGRNPYSTAMLDAAVASRLGPSAGLQGAQVQMHQKTEITVMPGANAKETAEAVYEQQSRVNGDMVRNMEGALR